MNPEKLQAMIQQADQLTVADVQGLEAMVADFPYYAWPAVLLSRHYKKEGDYRYEGMLQHAALLVPDRRKLYDWLHQEPHEDLVQPKEEGHSEESVEKKDSKEEELAVEEFKKEELDETVAEEAAAQELVIQETEIEATVEEKLTEEHEEEIAINEAGKNFNWDHHHEEIGAEEKSVNADTVELLGQDVIAKVGGNIEPDLQEENERLSKPKLIRQYAVYDIEQYFPSEKKEGEHKGSGDFYDWLTHPKQKQEGEEVIPQKKNKSVDLIDRFIQTNPGINKPKKEFFKPELVAKKSEQMPETLASETLARIYEQQGNYKGAIEMYERLILKNPEKKPFFAGLIEKIKKDHLS